MLHVRMLTIIILGGNNIITIINIIIMGMCITKSYLDTCTIKVLSEKILLMWSWESTLITSIQTTLNICIYEPSDAYANTLYSIPVL